MKRRSSQGNGSSPPLPSDSHLITYDGSDKNPPSSTADDPRPLVEDDRKNQVEGKVEAGGAESGNEEGSEGEGDEEEEEAAERSLAAMAEQRAEGDRPKLAEGFYEVQAIRKKRICKGEPQYLIKWRGWPESSNTWEPLEHLQLCPDVVEAFEQSLHSGKKLSRKRKRKYTQPKKKMLYSYGHSGSRVCNTKLKKARFVRKANDDSRGKDPAEVLGVDNEINGDSSSYGEAVSMRRITIQLQEPVKPGSEPVSGSKNDSSEPSSQGDRPTGAKRRKSGSVRRFKPESITRDPSSHRSSMPLCVSSCDRAEQLMTGNVDAYPKNKHGFLSDSSDITRIIKPVGYSSAISNNVQDVIVTFVAMRCDGKEVTVDNKFLKANNPLMLIDFYEQHLRYSTTAS